MDTSQIRRKAKRIWNIFLIVLVLVLIGFIYTRYFFVVGTGVKSGQLNYVVYKGYLFKTYEGKLIQAGFKSSTVTGTVVQSNEFMFSVGNKEIAEQLMLKGGKDVDLHYKEYMGALPWRGYSRYVVDSIVDIKN
ncbi:hypothetical protein AGMMS50239_30020 [Bacteroidia bacterium]|nr:hypothetical protein AGMMS50239_30020 [Bacteroidia bacterium]